MYNISHILFARRVFLVAGRSSVRRVHSAFCGRWPNGHWDGDGDVSSQSDRKMEERTCSEQLQVAAMQAVESTVESSPIAYLHLHTRTCSITFLISITNSPSSSSASTQLAAAMNKRNFLAVQRIRSSLSKYRGIILISWTSRSVCSEPEQEQRKAALLSSIQINLFEHHRPSGDFIFVYLPAVFYD